MAFIRIATPNAPKPQLALTIVGSRSSWAAGIVPGVELADVALAVIIGRLNVGGLSRRACVRERAAQVRCREAVKKER